MMRVLFLIRSLETGGAERQLVELVKGLDKSRFAVTVATFYGGGELRPDIEGLDGVRLESLEKRGRWDIPRFLFRLWRLLRETKPQIVHGYLGVANEIALLTARLAGAKVVWGVRASNMDFSRYDWAARWMFRVGAWLSRFADLIIVNSHAGARHHAAHGYCGSRMVVIPNGIDTDRFLPDREAGRRLRLEWGVQPHETLVGVVARLDPMKDHPTFLRAASLLVHETADLRFVCAGGGPEVYRSELRQLSQSLGLGDRVLWVGERSDTPAVFNALDVAVSSSYGEGFPNVVAEAMACGVPCVVTDVGDSALIVGDVGVVVPPRDPNALAKGLQRCLTNPDSPGLGRRGRRRIAEEFSLARMVGATGQALESVI
jgi:glycosyltransferase involved in cell wall biosynthesis